MIGALVYLQLTSLRNSLRQRLLRLKNPRYLFGALAGAFYFYLVIARHFFRPGAGLGVHRFSVESTGLAELIEPVAAFVLFTVLVLSWIIPSGRAALAFTETEASFLFPAPISRRSLIHFKLFQWQLAILITSLVLSLLSQRWAFLGGSIWTHALGWWLIFSFSNFHIVAASFTSDRLAALGVTPLRRRLVIAAVLSVIFFVAIIWIRQHLSGPESEDLANAASTLRYLDHLLEAPPIGWLLWPFRLVVRPFLAGDPILFLQSLWPVLLLCAAQYIWVIRSEVAFEEGSLALAQRRAERLNARRQGKLSSRPASVQARREPFKLNPLGRPALAFLWTNLIAAGPRYYARSWMILAAVMIGAEGWLLSQPHLRPFVKVVSIAAGSIGAYGLLLGPILIRRGAQRLIQRLDQMKAYPIRGWEVIFGELLSPITLLSAAEWILLALVSIAAGNGVLDKAITPLLAASGAAGLALLVPPLIGLMFGINFVGILYFPAWLVSAQPGVGIEKSGQRLIFLVGYLVVLIVCLAPALGLAGLVFFLSRLLVDSLAFGIVLTAVIAAGVLAAEFAAMIWWLGNRYERFDISAELPR